MMIAAIVSVADAKIKWFEKVGESLSAMNYGMMQATLMNPDS